MYVIITKALGSGGKVPTCAALALELNPEAVTGKAVPPKVVKAVNERLLKLQEEHRFLQKKRRGTRKSRAWYLDTTAVVSEADSAFYLKILVDSCPPPASLIAISKLHEKLRSQYRFVETELARIYPRATQNAYVEQVGEDVRPGERTYSQLPYLVLRAKDYQYA